MSECKDCELSEKCKSCTNLSYRQLLMSFLLAAVSFCLIYFGFGSVRAAETPSCYTRDQVSSATEKLNRCLTIYGDGVYDFTVAKQWDLTGHVGQHLCGKEYDKATIESGPHPLAVIDRFYSASLCGTNSVNAQKIAKPTGLEVLLGGSISIRRIMVYVALLFFVLNFATCYAMPWAKFKEPWNGDVPGSDSKDALGKFPLTHWHKIWAWLAVFSLCLHAFLSFSCMLFQKCF